MDKVIEYLKQFGLDKDVEITEKQIHHVSQAVDHNIEPDQIAKTICFYDKDKNIIDDFLPCNIIVVSGLSSISTGELKRALGFKTSMMNGEDVMKATGFLPGGVCPFAITNPHAKIFLDVSLKKYKIVIPACGDDHSLIRISIENLEKSCSNFSGWVDVTKKPIA